MLLVGGGICFVVFGVLCSCRPDVVKICMCVVFFRCLCRSSSLEVVLGQVKSRL